MQTCHRVSQHQISEDVTAHLVELEIVEEIVEFPVLLLFFQLVVELLQSVQSQLGLVVDVDLQGLRWEDQCHTPACRGKHTHALHELFASHSDLFGQSG